MEILLLNITFLASQDLAEQFFNFNDPVLFIYNPTAINRGQLARGFALRDECMG